METWLSRNGPFRDATRYVENDALSRFGVEQNTKHYANQPDAATDPELKGEMSLASYLDRNRTIAKPGFSRWMVPPAALCITQSAPGDWKLTQLGWIFSIAIFMLGASAAVMGRWVEEGARCLPPRSASAADSWSPGLECRYTISGSSIWATACSGASGSGSVTSRQFPR